LAKTNLLILAFKNIKLSRVRAFGKSDPIQDTE
jgi:hypothetical protein